MGDNSIIPRPPQAIAPTVDPEQKLVRMWLHGKSRHTQRSYGRAWHGRFRAFCDKPLPEIGLDDLQAFDLHLQRIGLKAGSRHGVIAAVKSFFAFVADRLRLLTVNVAAGLKVPEVKEAISKRILLENQVEQLLAAAAPGRDRLILLVLYRCGLRREELAGLKWSDFEPLETGAVCSIVGKGQKMRTLPISPGLWDDLKQLRGPSRNDGSVFRISASQIYRIVRAAAEKAGIGKVVSPHFLRHCMASHAISRGADLALIQARLGHANITTTGKYLHARPGKNVEDFLPKFGETCGGK